MKKLRGSLWAKVLAIALLCLLALVCAGSTVAAYYLYDAGAYDGGYEDAAANLLAGLGYGACQDAGRTYLLGDHTAALSPNSNFRYTVLSMDGEELYSNYEGEATLWDAVHVVTLFNNYTGEILEFTDMAQVEAWRQENSVRVHGYVLKSLPVQDRFSQRLSWFDAVYRVRDIWLWVAVASLLLGILLFVFLISAAGHRDETDTVTPNFVDRIPWDLLTGILGFGVAWLLFGIGITFNYDIPILVFNALAFLLAGLLFLLWCMSSATRLKLGTLIRGCLIYRILRWCWRAVKKLCRWLTTALPLFWKWALGLAALAFIDLLWRMGSRFSGGQSALGWFLFWLLLAAGSFYAALSFRRLRLGAQKIAAGEEGVTVNTSHLIGDFKAHAEDLNNIRAGLSRAVDERMKSERFKTELITNVSHDIKTPLTSIVSYVDLLSREEIENETAREYIAVLQRQSERIKKLIEDLLDASKASTGNLPVSLTDCELGVLLEQAVGEYGERLQDKQLELVVKKPDEAVTVRADSRHLWRILDNLMSNVLKYAQAGTRVYLTLERRDGEAELSFRNISAAPLNFTGEELTERFVRGDASRSTEGSGLGLAIAKSLADLQDIGMDITVDGDLFKVVLRFKVS